MPDGYRLALIEQLGDNHLRSSLCMEEEAIIWNGVGQEVMGDE